MHQATSARGCEQAIIPFSVAHSSPSPAHCSPAWDRDATSGNKLHAEPLYLSLQKGEQVRVLRREYRHGMSPYGTSSYTLASAADGAVLSPPRWCIAQREDGTIGLVPGSLLQRVPGVLFSRRNASAVEVHCDRLQSPSSLETPTATRRGQRGASEVSEKSAVRGADVVRPTQTTSEKSDSLGNHVPDRDGKVDYRDVDVADALQLQRRRPSTLQERLDTFVDAPFTAILARKEPHATASAVSSPIAPCGAETAGGVDCSEKCEQLRLMQEEARMRAELHWLTDEVVPRLQAACTEEQAKLEKMQQDGCCRSAADFSSSSCGSESSLNPLAALEREQARVAGLLERAISLQAGLAREALVDAVREPQRSMPPNGSDLTVRNAGCEAREPSVSAALGPRNFDAGLPGPLKGSRASRGNVAAQGLKAPKSCVVEKLRLLVTEETETLDSYRAQRLALHQRMSRLAELMQDVAAEEASLKESETALHRLLGRQTCDLAVDFAWPRTLQGLTDEEEASLRASLHTFDKYTRKLQRIADEDQCGTSMNDTSSSVDMSLLLGAPPASLGTTTCAASPDQRLHSNGRALTCERERTVAAPTSSRLEHLREVMEKGGRELAQLQAKLEAAQRFCDTYSPVAREIEEQLRLGERLLAAKKQYLTNLQVAESGDSLTSGF
ncbi:hypothetical protein JIQ42_04284 [Leishmania sp. Namibia]|uniref:hypothetical protein n=1 Tax=Leishmania sp. Namibia TaxID=2802991 RepID=UPI001B61E88B|nr:hypothetical protein JIQ42_04284 [Leishmania sp. Namibia]